LRVLRARGGQDERPLVPGVIQGLRIWDADTDELRLCGFEHVAWEAGGKETVARCLAGGRHWGLGEGSKPPVGDCRCGLYAHHLFLEEFLDEIDDLHRGRSYEHMLVMGVIEAWGKVELHEEGFRAERARPVALLIPHGVSDRRAEEIEQLAEAYCCEAVELGPGAGVDELTERFDRGMDRAAVVELLKPVYEADGLTWRDDFAGGYFGPGPDYGKLYWSKPWHWPGLVSQEITEFFRPVDEFMRPAYPVIGKVARGLKEATAITMWVLLYLAVWGWVWVLGGYIAYLGIKEIWPF
jgi:hypothetical protein